MLGRSLGAHGRCPFDVESARIGRSLTWQGGRQHEHVQVNGLTSEVPAQRSLILRCWKTNAENKDCANTCGGLFGGSSFKEVA
jgi:hypothetical protein